METIDDIVREMRSSPLSWLTPHQIPQMSHDNEEVKKFADRIAAAVEAERKGWQQKIYGIDLMLQRAIDSLSIALNRCDYNEFKQGE